MSGGKEAGNLRENPIFLIFQICHNTVVPTPKMDSGYRVSGYRIICPYMDCTDIDCPYIDCPDIDFLDIDCLDIDYLYIYCPDIDCPDTDCPDINLIFRILSVQILNHANNMLYYPYIFVRTSRHSDR